MNYSSGEIVIVDDHVLIEHGKTLGIVEYIIESEKDMEEWNLGKQGLLLNSPPFGSVFWPIGVVDDPIIFVSRGNNMTR